jgi:hypothetical protein
MIPARNGRTRVSEPGYLPQYIDNRVARSNFGFRPTVDLPDRGMRNAVTVSAREGVPQVEIPVSNGGAIQLPLSTLARFLLFRIIICRLEPLKTAFGGCYFDYFVCVYTLFAGGMPRNLYAPPA